MTCKFNKAEWVSGNLAIRPIQLNKGGVVKPHDHEMDHTTFVLAGSILVTMSFHGEEKSALFTDARQQPDNYYCLVPRGWNHEITAREDNTRIICVFPTVFQDGDTVNEDRTGWAYG